MATHTLYGDISPRTAAYASKELLKRAAQHLVFEKFGQSKTLPERSSKTIKFRRYDALDSTPKYLSEGVTPTGKKISQTDVTLTLSQVGDWVGITDVIQDTHEDPVFQEQQDVISLQAAEMVEKVRYGRLKAGTNVQYAGGVTSRANVVSALNLNLQRQAIKALKRQNARKITSVVRSTAAYGTVNVAPSFVSVCHPDLQGDVENLPGFKAAEDYGSLSPYENEIGKVGEVRYLSTTICEPWQSAGGNPSTNGVVSTDGSSADVYPILVFGADAYGIVALKGKFAITPMVHNPTVSDSDKLAQRGHVGWKSMQDAVILNQLWMLRMEVACTDW